MVGNSQNSVRCRHEVSDKLISASQPPCQFAGPEDITDDSASRMVI